MIVRTLLGKKNIPLALRCLKSLAVTSEEKISFIVHEDGSLQKEDFELLRIHLPIDSFVSREEADYFVNEKLKSYPFCFKYRSSAVLSLKLIDVALLSEGRPLYFVDSDVYFINRHQGLFQNILQDCDCVFMQDINSAYSSRYEDVSPFTNVRLIRALNSGIFAFDSAKFDIDYLEYYLARFGNNSRFVNRRYWSEQTCWSYFAAGLRCRIYGGKQLIIATRGIRPSTNCVGIHLAWYKNMLDLPEWQNHEPSQSSPIQVKTDPARHMGTPGLIWADLVALGWHARDQLASIKRSILG